MAPNNSFKPNLLRYTNNMAGKARHVVGSATQAGLIQALGMYGEMTVDETIDVSLDRIRAICSSLSRSGEGFYTGDVIRAYCGIFCSNQDVPTHYSFNAQFEKLLKRNEKNLGIIRAAESQPMTDDHGQSTNSSIWWYVWEH